jgi:hypothetical protein
MEKTFPLIDSRFRHEFGKPLGFVNLGFKGILNNFFDFGWPSTNFRKPLGLEETIPSLEAGNPLHHGTGLSLASIQ